MTEPLLGRPQFAAPVAPPYVSHQIHLGVFTPEECDEIVGIGSDIEAGEGLLEGTDGGEVTDDSIRSSRTSWIPPDDDTWWIYERLAEVAATANEVYGFDLSGFGEDLQFTHYDQPGSFYTWHQDGLDGGVATRKLSLVAQLTDPSTYDGAELQLFDVVEDFDREELAGFTAASLQQGAVIVFPAFEYHRVLPLRSGVRYSLVSWVSGPAFR